MDALTKLNHCKRVVIKIGSALLVDMDAHKLRDDWLVTLAQDVAQLRDEGKEVLIVSSGAIALGREMLGYHGRALALDEAQAAASIGQIELMNAYQTAFAPYKIQNAQILLTSEDGNNRRRYLNTRATLDTLFKEGIVPIVNENDTVATDEIRFGDNDRLAAQIAVMCSADLVVLLSDIDGVYTDNPRDNPDAEHIAFIDEITPEIKALAKGKGSAFSKGGMITKILAAETAIKGGASMMIAQGETPSPIKAIKMGARATVFEAKTDPVQARKSWILAMKATGQVVIDEGASNALKKGASLLPAGVKDISGEFMRGDCVEIYDDAGVLRARGLIGFESKDAKAMKGKTSEDIANELGVNLRRALIHRDNLVWI